MRWVLIGLRVFVPTSIFFGGYMALVLGTDTQVSVIDGVCFGVWMTAVLVGVAAYRLRGRSDIELTSCQHELLVVPMPIDEAHARAGYALTSLPARITSDGGYRLVGRTGMSWGSWGEVVSIDLRPADSSTAVSVHSRPRTSSAVVDFRRNRDNVIRVTAALAAPTTQPAARY